MSVLLLNRSKQIHHVSTICHASSEPVGLREITDPSIRLVVYAFPFQAIHDVVHGSSLERLGFYLLTSRERVYVGEGLLASRLREHAVAADKQFAAEVFAVSALESDMIDKQTVRFCERKLFELARDRRHVHVVNEVTPPGAAVSHWQSAMIERMLDAAYRLLFDAGCRVFETTESGGRAPEPSLVTVAGTDIDLAVVELSSFVVPEGAVEYRLTYNELLLVRGYDVGGGFVVGAGSDMRRQLNASANPIIGRRRVRLIETGAVVESPSRSGRFQFRVPVWFPSPATAAQVVTGAHVNATHWSLVERADTTRQRTGGPA